MKDYVCNKEIQDVSNEMYHLTCPSAIDLHLSSTRGRPSRDGDFPRSRISADSWKRVPSEKGAALDL